jgi:hypothetical protein
MSCDSRWHVVTVCVNRFKNPNLGMDGLNLWNGDTFQNWFSNFYDFHLWKVLGIQRAHIGFALPSSAKNRTLWSKMGLTVLCSAHIFAPCPKVYLHDFWETSADQGIKKFRCSTRYIKLWYNLVDNDVWIRNKWRKSDINDYTYTIGFFYLYCTDQLGDLPLQGRINACLENLLHQFHEI